MTRLPFCLALLAAAISSLLAAGTARAELLFGLTEGQQLVTFDSQTRSIGSSLALTGLANGDTLLGIDFRPSTGELYGFSTGNRFYKINTNTGAATTVGAALNLIDIVKSFDFDPVNDDIRVLTNLRKNIRVNPNNGAMTSYDTLLNFAAGDPNAGTAPQVVQGAYTNSYAGAQSSTLFTLEAAKDVLAIQSPQNTGMLTTVGSLGASLGTLLSFNGMDISGSTGIGFVVGQSLLSGGLVQNVLYTVDLATGTLQVAGNITGTPQAGPMSSYAYTWGSSTAGSGGGSPTPDPNWDCGGISGAGLLIDVAAMPPAVPEPSTVVLAGLGGVALIAAARRKTRGKKA